MKKPQRRRTKPGWESVSKWYDGIVGKKGHYYHENVILPRLLDYIQEQYPKSGKLLDLACGQGVLARALPRGWTYHGVDVAPSLIQAAKKMRVRNAQFSKGDVTKALNVDAADFDVATLILALQDIADMPAVFRNASDHLAPGGRLLIVMNHPYFRIPRQSHWGVDEQAKLQYRRVDSYLSPLEVPIRVEPSKGERSRTVKSYHRPLEQIVAALSASGLLVDGLHEWVSDKKSTGSKARMENRARREFPLFLFLSARKTTS